MLKQNSCYFKLLNKPSQLVLLSLSFSSCWAMEPLANTKSSTLTTALLTSQEEQNLSHYSGKPISLNFQDIKLRAILQIIAEFTGINIVVSDTVEGAISLNLNDIPWDEALDIILRSHNLMKRKINNVIFIAPSTEMFASKRNVVERQQRNLKPLPLYSMLLRLNYAKVNDIALLLRGDKANFLSSRGRLTVDHRTNALWVQDTMGQMRKIREFIKRFDQPMRQVLIEARIVNVTKDAAKDLGLRFGLNRGLVKQSAQKADETGKLEESTNLSKALNLDFITAPLSSLPAASTGFVLAKLANNILLDLELSALESEGRGEVISSPRLMTTSKKAALIESGEEVPYQEATLSGGTATAFKKAVLSLKVTPEITSDNHILMDLHLNQDILSAKIFNGVPSILTKELQTRVLVKNGQTIVLGGIYKQDKFKTVNRLPVLGHLPIIGRLFSNQSTMVKNEELLIFITPRIIAANLLEERAKKDQQASDRTPVLLNKFTEPKRLVS